MHLCKCTVLLSGEVMHQVSKINVTPAEILILKAIHGNEAVTNVVPTTNNKRPHAEEYDRLMQIYGQTKVGGQPVVEKLFPGASPKLPSSLKDIGLQNTGDIGRIADGKPKADVTDPDDDRKEAPYQAPGGEELTIDPETPTETTGPIGGMAG